MKNLKKYFYKYRLIYLPLSIFLITLLIFLPTIHNEFIFIDDDRNFLFNDNYKELNYQNLKWVFTTTLNAQYTPIVWLSFLFNWHLFKEKIWSYFLVNIILHSINAILIFFIYLLIMKNRNYDEEKILFISFISALLFAIHPLRVENVSWLTQRKDLLSSFFYYLMIVLYIKKESTQFKYNIPLIIFYLLGLLSKISGVFLGFVLFLIDLYTEKIAIDKNFLKINRKIIIEKIPYITIGMLFYIIEIYFIGIKQNYFNPHQLITNLDTTVTKITMSIIFYISKTFIPHNLYLINDFVNTKISYIIMLLILMISVYLIKNLKKKPNIALGWFSYLILISITIDIPNINYTDAANKYSYLTTIFLYPLIGHYFYFLYTKNKTLFISMFFIFFSYLTYQNINYQKIFKNTETLCLYHINKGIKQNYFYKTLADYYIYKNLNEKALYYLHEIIKSKQLDWDIYNRMGIIYSRMQKHDKALEYFKKAINLNPNNPALKLNYENELFIMYLNKLISHNDTDKNL